MVQSQEVLRAENEENSHDVKHAVFVGGDIGACAGISIVGSTRELPVMFAHLKPEGAGGPFLLCVCCYFECSMGFCFVRFVTQIYLQMR